KVAGGSGRLLCFAVRGGRMRQIADGSGISAAPAALGGLEGARRNRQLDGLRGLAALAVAVAHSINAMAGLRPYRLKLADLPDAPWTDVVNRLLNVLFPGDAAVVVFFVLSGHVLMLSLLRREAPHTELGPFVARRVFRIFPIAIVAAMPLAFLLPTLTAREIVGAMLLFNAKANGVLWSLQVELIGSVLIFAAWAISRLYPALVWPVGAIICLAAWRYPHPFVIFLPAFMLGFVAARLPAGIAGHRLFLVASLCLLLFPQLIYGKSITSIWMAMIGAFGLVASVISRPLRVLDMRPVQFLGAVSYPFYLLHLTGALLALKMFAAFGWSPRSQHVLVAAVIHVCSSIAIALVLAWIARVTVEVPCMRAARDVRLWSALVRGWRRQGG
ncbi:MAG: acyltransferase, partial [Rhodospirillaceae bacterium]|nr:acyltransferase [Rhodospirillaceae bacterium]